MSEGYWTLPKYITRRYSIERDIIELYQAIDSPNNGLTFCRFFWSAWWQWFSGHVRTVRRPVHFIHLRSAKRDEKGNFYEADHLEGDVGT